MINDIIHPAQEPKIQIRVDLRMEGNPEEFWNVINNGEQMDNPFVPGEKVAVWQYMPQDAIPGQRRAGAKADIEIVDTEHGPMLKAYVTPIDNLVISRSYHNQIVKFPEEDYRRLHNLLLQFYDEAKVSQAIELDRRIEYVYV